MKKYRPFILLFSIISTLVFLIQCKEKETQQLPQILTLDCYDTISSCHFVLWGKTISDRAAPIIERGICIGLNEYDTLMCHVADVVDKGDKLFLCGIEHLTPNTTYYYKAYAKNSYGTAYGEIKSFQTGPETVTSLIIRADVTSPTDAIVQGLSAMEWCPNYMQRGICWGIDPDPDISSNAITENKETDTFSIHLTGLVPGTGYYVRPWTLTNAGLSYGKQVRFTTISKNYVRDVEGNYYDQVSIGSQVWLRQNLRTSTFRDGSPIQKVTYDAVWFNKNQVSLCGEILNNKMDIFSFGRIYNNYVVIDSRHVCPEGWHIPSEDEWKTLESYLGGAAFAGIKLKDIWSWNPADTATDESGFSAVPSSYPSRYYDPQVDNPTYTYMSDCGVHAAWWSSSQGVRWLEHFSSSIFSIIPSGIPPAYSIRCIKD